MSDTHENLWNEWAQAYQGFSDVIEPYKEAQKIFIQSIINALGEQIYKEKLLILDVGGGAGNLIEPELEMIEGKRGHLKGLTYVLTDSSETMIGLTNKRLIGIKKIFPDVIFDVIHVDTLSDTFIEIMVKNIADIVMSSWNIEYYVPEKRQEIVNRLAGTVRDHGIVAFSSTMRFPDNITLKNVLMPLGKAQVFHAFITGGPRRMKKVINALKQIARFSDIITNEKFPEKPKLIELEEIARQAGFESISIGYHLYGGSGMVISQKKKMMLPEIPESHISKVLAGKPGYENKPETISFWGYLLKLSGYNKGTFKSCPD